MITLYTWTTPNGRKISIALEEMGLRYETVPVDLLNNQQFDPEYLKISPNNKIPAIIDSKPAIGDQPVSMFESGAILLYLAEKIGQFIPTDLAGRADVLQWLFWQMGGLGPLLGQNLHFSQYASETLPYAIDRYVDETARLFKVLDRRLADRQYIAGNYSIADIASYPWVFKHPYLEQDLADFPNLKRWFEQVADRTATQSAYRIGASVNTVPTVTEESKKFLMGQSASPDFASLADA